MAHWTALLLRLCFSKACGKSYKEFVLLIWRAGCEDRLKDPSSECSAAQQVRLVRQLKLERASEQDCKAESGKLGMGVDLHP